MTKDQISTMSVYYTEKYGTPTSPSDAISKLVAMYRDLFDEIPKQEVKEGIAEYYRILCSRELDAYIWIAECLHVTAKKEKQKRTFAYCVGMLRSWMKNGFGHLPNQEEDELVDYFQEVTGFEVKHQARSVIQNLMGKYGIIKVTRMIGNLENASDLGLVLMLHLKELMDNEYSTDVLSESDKANSSM
ncbi:hypothetical protein [Bacillus tequilensis]|uniref:hypothetical protein n=1 Tax=Bacillus tequilensis TaxID=227866 RepID=UPI00046531A6|nr:hypothetical protein [Bacillus tequilensis]MDR4436205.1 hypothetical protein [Bacillus tequilensis]SPU01157.1 Uncharacterised protein [Bacillus tequilensis]